MSDRPVVISQLGNKHSQIVADAVTEVDVVPVLNGDPVPDRADVLVSAPWGRADLPRVLDTGVSWVHTMSTGVDKLDLELFRDVTLTCARGTNSVAISEWVLAQMLAFEQQLPQMWITEPVEQWNLADLGTMVDRRIGLVGFGSIAREIATRVLAFGSDVRAVRRTHRPAEIDRVAIVGDLSELAAWADHLVVAVPSTSETRQMIDVELLSVVGPGLHLVNIARGAHVDQGALRLALDDGRVALASLDVVDPEPLPSGHWLYEHPKVHVSAHVSWSAPDAWEGTVQAFIEQLRRWLHDEPLHDVVDLDAGY